MNCPHCGAELHAHVYINAQWVGWYCPWCNVDVPNDKPRPITTENRRARE